MENYDIISVLEQYAILQSWHFVYGFDNFEKNRLLLNDYAAGKHVFIVDSTYKPTFNRGKLQKITYTCGFALGRKSEIIEEQFTSAELHETTKQKFERRLKDLLQSLSSAIENVSCANELNIVSASLYSTINQYDENLDFAVADVVFES